MSPSVWRGRTCAHVRSRCYRSEMTTALVTGGSGFIGSHCILQLLAAGHHVRTTVRSPRREGDVRAMLKQGGADPGGRLSFAVADLEKDAGWAEAVAGCEYVLHVASPFPANIPQHEDEVIVPAREGALRVMRASRDAGVKRVVLTSSFAAIGYGHALQEAPFDETSWTNLDGDDVRPYVKSKTLAERAAWEFVAREGGGLELSVVNPVGVFGPVLGADYSTSILMVQRLMDGAIPVPADPFRRRRRARRHRPARPRHDASGRPRRTLPRGRRRFHVDARHGSGAEATHGRVREARADPAAAQLARACGRDA
jgi:nucleoside-diphosphate-sugar epimerase